MTAHPYERPCDWIAERCVVAVIDKQRWYLDPATSPFPSHVVPTTAKAAVTAQDDFIAAARTARVPVLWTTMTEGDNNAPENVLWRWRQNPATLRLRTTDPAHAIMGTGPNDDEFVAAKVYPDAFSNLQFREVLSATGRQVLILIGAYAARCVLATAFSAQVHGYQVIVPAGLVMAHPWYEHEYEVFHAVLDSVVGTVVSPDEIVTGWRNML